MKEKSLILLQSETPSNQWLTKDTETKIIRAYSHPVANPQQLSEAEIDTLKRLIDFVRYSQNEELNHKGKEDYLRPAVGLAAPQIGVNKQMFFIRLEINGKRKEYAIINPKMIAKSRQIAALEAGEGCLSVDIDQTGIVPRSYKIVVEAYDWLQQKEVQLTLRGYRAIVFQHEMDHLVGKLYYDYINPENPNYAADDWFLL